MSFTAERNLPLPRLHHACAEESQRHVPWIPAPSFCAIPQLDPQRFDEERSFHSATSTCWFQKAGSQSRCRVLNPLQLPLGSYPWNSEELYWLILISVSQYNTILIILYRFKPLDKWVDIDSTNPISMIFLWYRIFIVRYRKIFDIVCYSSIYNKRVGGNKCVDPTISTWDPKL